MEFTIFDGTQLKVWADASDHVMFQNKGTPGGSNSHYWYSVNSGTPVAAYQSWGTTHDAGAIPRNGTMESYFVATQTGAGNVESYWGLIFNDGINSANNWMRGFVITSG